MGIDAYLTFAYWVGLAGITIRILLMTISEYPRKSETSLGSDVSSLILSIAAFAWVCFLRFNN